MLYKRTVMEFYLALTRRHGFAKCRSTVGITCHRGYLRIAEEYQSDLRRHARVARLVDDKDQPVPEIVPLLDPQLLHAKRGLWVLTGIERIEPDTGQIQDVAQTWLLTPVTELEWA